ncbi:ImcF-related family protein [Pseudomonas sp. zfem002]|uniref:ImcF-related family protein n=1 Tax=Pseudomonas sp. zfem002 TaxID=3078197 RepID=UPI002927DF13|nr:ImcF-related family protein [Pseudomonas sp. zfem002]MDU9393614.1 ImcF-related family protein [Pseudomonas sp. zfem002]
MNSTADAWRFAGAALLLSMLVATLVALAWAFGDAIGLHTVGHKLLAVLLVFGCLLMLFLIPKLLTVLEQRQHRRQAVDNKAFPARDVRRVVPVETRSVLSRLRDDVRGHYGPFWRRKTRLLLLAGEPAEIEAIAPGLTEQRWLVGERTVLLWAGSLRHDPDPADLALWRRLSRWRGLDGLVWALTREQSLDDNAMGLAQQNLRALARDLHWHLPLYVWQVCESKWSQAGRESYAVGCTLPAKAGAGTLQHELSELLAPLRVTGLAQMKQNKDMRHDFCLRLSAELRREGIQRWPHVLGPWLNEAIRGVTLRGLWFSQPFAPRSEAKLGHLWLADNAWQGVIADRTHPRRLGWQTPRIVPVGLLLLALIWGAGMALSFTSNRAQIAEMQTTLATLDQAEQGDAQLLALHELVRELARLDHRTQHGTPWYQRFGLNQNQALLDTLWPRYVEINARLLRDPAVALLQSRLDALVRLPPDSPERATRAAASYDQLKAWLMLARPEKADPAFLVRVMGELEPERAGFSPGAWHTLAPGLWQFYAEHLEAHPAVALEPRLLLQARQVLIGQLGQRNAEASLYQQVLDSAATHYPDLPLAQMLGESDNTLFSSQNSVAGVFTRQAWEGHVREAIDKIAEARREEIDWVLSDNHQELAAELSPDQLRKRLTARYFQDYSSAWLTFLNSLRWQRAGSLAEVIDQLTLMSDVRLSPLLALMDTLAWQGRAGTREQALADSLLQSAQNLLGKEKTQLVERAAQHLDSPLDDTFGPLLNLLGKDEAQGERLSLQAFLTRVTRVRLKLQQVSNAADPREMTQALAQTVFQGKSVDLSDTRAYGSLLAASLGAEWGTVGETLFVQPLDQAWQRVLQPSAQSLNSQWQRSVVDEWQRAFDGRYPFAATDSDASLPMLGQMIRSDSGRIDQFLHSQLSGVLRKEGSRWVADPQHSQGLRFDPKFIEAVNRLSHLADVLYTDGGLGLSFELRGKPVRDIAETIFTLDGEKHHYFNQRERWQRFIWPGAGEHPGTRVTWTSVNAGTRLYGDYQGVWGLIRLLEQAKVTLLDDGASRYRLELLAPDGRYLTWHLRTELGAGPLALLELRSFKLPKRIFLDAKGA